LIGACPPGPSEGVAQADRALGFAPQRSGVQVSPPLPTFVRPLPIGQSIRPPNLLMTKNRMSSRLYRICSSAFFGPHRFGRIAGYQFSCFGGEFSRTGWATLFAAQPPKFLSSFVFSLRHIEKYSYSAQACQAEKPCNLALDMLERSSVEYCHSVRRKRYGRERRARQGNRRRRGG
jgi:hypothetical protein